MRNQLSTAEPNTSAYLKRTKYVSRVAFRATEYAATYYRSFENNAGWKKAIKVLDVGLLNSFHLPVMYSIIGAKFGWGAALPLIGVTPVGLIVGAAVGVMAFNISMRMPILFPKLGNKLQMFAQQNPTLQNFPRTKKFILDVTDEKQNSLITQKAVGLSLLGFAALSPLSGTAMTTIMGMWYGGLSGISNWVQGLRTAAQLRNDALEPHEQKENVDDAVLKTTYGRVLQKLIGKNATKIINFSPLLGSISMLGMGLSMTSAADASFGQMLAQASGKLPILVGSGLFLTTAAFQISRVTGLCNWGGSFGRLAAAAGMTTIATSMAYSMGLDALTNTSFILASASALSNVLVARLEDAKKITARPAPWPIKQNPLANKRTMLMHTRARVVEPSSYHSYEHVSQATPAIEQPSRLEQRVRILRRSEKQHGAAAPTSRRSLPMRPGQKIRLRKVTSRKTAAPSADNG